MNAKFSKLSINIKYSLYNIEKNLFSDFNFLSIFLFSSSKSNESSNYNVDLDSS